MYQVIILVVFGFFIQSSFARECGDALPRKNRASKEISLAPGFPAPAFYARSGRFAILIDPKTVELVLTARIERSHLKEDEKLMMALKKPLPLTEYVDIFRPALEEGGLFPRTEYLLADLLEQGKVALINLHLVGTGADPLVRQITVVSGGGGRTPERREFCAPSGELLHGVMDSIS